MSGGRFASITAGLLARKGDAQPSTMPDEAQMHRALAWQRQSPPMPTFRAFDKRDQEFSVPPLDRRAAESGTLVRETSPPARDLRFVEPPEVLLEEVPSAPVVVKREIKAPEPAQIEKPRRLFVNLSPDEYERLGIVAVKRDSSRHQLLRDALDAFLKKAAKEYKDGCLCLSGEGCKGSCSS